MMGRFSKHLCRFSGASKNVAAAFAIVASAAT